jgi:hypothetical protein
MSKYLGTQDFVGSDFQDRVSAKHEAICAAFGRKSAPYVHSEYPKAITVMIEGQEKVIEVASKEQEDSFRPQPK